MLLAFTFGIDKDIIKVYYHKNVKFLCQDLIDTALECGRCISQSKKHHLILKMAIATPKCCFLFIAFLDPHLIIKVGKIGLGETLSSI